MPSPAKATVASVIPSLHYRNAPTMDAKQEGYPRSFGDCDAWMERAA